MIISLTITHNLQTNLENETRNLKTQSKAEVDWKSDVLTPYDAARKEEQTRMQEGDTEQRPKVT